MEATFYFTNFDPCAFIIINLYTILFVKVANDWDPSSCLFGWLGLMICCPSTSSFVAGLVVVFFFKETSRASYSQGVELQDNFPITFEVVDTSFSFDFSNTVNFSLNILRFIFK